MNIIDRILSGQTNNEKPAEQPLTKNNGNSHNAIERILGGGRSSSGKGEYRCILGRCTKQVYDIMHGKVDVSLGERFQTSVKMVKCEKCGLIDALRRSSPKQSFPATGKCPECGGTQRWIMK